ncbi:hypothetical protein [Rhodococcus globerulus]|uniref:Helicase XPB/Ssl2 N-terminal domain-containing protein n=1 Tax=Rhodococcus globerulus TaxID=33008 RepID=A0ABU4C0P8_RHOGO|nr:hypothetical protein [Rhodococcus globerulus]MDV6269831.1 hypothetical protein [Rhodococcus globerulus]
MSGSSALTLGVNSLPATELSDTLWVDILPWLDDYVSDRAALLEPLAPSPDWWFSESPSFTVLEVDLEKLLSELASLYISHHSSAVLKESFPLLDPTVPISALALDTRAVTSLARLASQGNVGDLLTHATAEIFGVRGTSEQTVHDVVLSLLVCAVMTDPRSRIETPDDGAAPPAITALLDDLEQLAMWRRVRGQDARPLVTVEIDDESPEPIQELAARISALTPNDLPAMDRTDAMDEIDNLFSQLDERESIVLRERIVAPVPQRRGAVGAKLGVGSGRVGQIEAEVKAKINDACGFGTAVGNLLASLRVEIQPVALLERLLELHPSIAAEVPGYGVPLWLVLDRIDDYFEVTDGWAAAPGVAAAKKRTQTLLEDFESPNGVVALGDVADTVSMSACELEKWLTWCGITVVSGSALTRARRISDLAVGALEALGTPKTVPELAALLRTDRTERSIERALEADDRAVLDAGLWHLQAWGSADSIVEEPVPEQSEFNVGGDGIVRRKRTRDIAKPPEQTRRLYRSGNVWRYRTAVTAEHLRGSSFAVPAGLAVAAGCARGESVELESHLGVQAVRWSGAQPTFGTIRRFLRELSAVVGEDILLELWQDGTFRVVRPVVVHADVDPLRQALAEIGNREPLRTADRHVVRILAEAVSLPGEDRPRKLLRAYEDRGEDIILDLLEAAWVHSDVSADSELGDA